MTLPSQHPWNISNHPFTYKVCELKDTDLFTAVVPEVGTIPGDAGETHFFFFFFFFFYSQYFTSEPRFLPPSNNPPTHRLGVLRLNPILSVYLETVSEPTGEAPQAAPLRCQSHAQAVTLLPTDGGKAGFPRPPSPAQSRAGTAHKTQDNTYLASPVYHVIKGPGVQPG